MIKGRDTFTQVRNITSQEALLLYKMPKDPLYTMIINNSCRQQFKFRFFTSKKQQQICPKLGT